MKNRIIQISTKNLLLRTLEISDAAELQGLLHRNKRLMLPWIPWANEEPQTIEQKVEKIVEWRTEFLAGTKFIYGIYAINDELAGLIFLFTRQGPGKLEIGYIIDKGFTGKGFATESSYGLTRLGFEHLKIDEMVIHCNANNTASARIPEKLGYHLAERKVDGANEMLIWSLRMEHFKKIRLYETVSFIEEKININA